MSSLPNFNTMAVTMGLTAICIVAMITANNEVAIGALAALAGWLGGNSNGKKHQVT